jgi:hypothetical protein
MVKPICLKHFTLLLATVFFTLSLGAQDSSGVTSFKYVVLHPNRNNNAAPDYPKLRPGLEDGIKDLLTRAKVPMLKYQKEASGKKLQHCDTLICTYAITYTNGMMLNAKIKCTLTFTDCNKKEVYSTSESKMTGAVATADTYLKVFAKLIGPDLMNHLGGSE